LTFHAGWRWSIAATPEKIDWHVRFCLNFQKSPSLPRQSPHFRETLLKKKPMTGTGQGTIS
ncbi:hypothetical protein, partial [Rhizobium oryzihabitans]|uniref:hypothetical protein n=1 Tax=Rhizobium oryzihabitans TaxID=2267833 RepID=UPI0040368052